MRIVRTQRGSQLIELTLMLPLVLSGIFACWWLLFAGVEQLLGMYAQSMAARAASVAWVHPADVARRQAQSLDPRVAPPTRWRIFYAPQPVATAVGGDNPLEPMGDASW